MDWHRRVVEASAGGLWVVDLEGRTLEVNEAAAALLGVDREAMASLTHADFLDEEGRAQYAVHRRELEAGQANTAEVDCLFHRPDGTAVWAVVREALLRDDDGRVVAVVQNLDDITTRKRLVEELQHSQRQRRDAEQVARFGSWELDVATRTVSWSDGLARLYGARVATVFATPESFYDAVHPDDRERVETASRRLHDGEESFEFEARVNAERGYVWIYGRGVAMRDDDGTLVSVVGTHVDVTQVRDTDDALRDLVKQNDLMQTVASRANEATTLVEVLEEARLLVLLHDDWDRARAFTPTADGTGLEVLGGDEDDTDPVVAARERLVAQRCLERRGPVWDDDVRLTLAFPIVLHDEVIAVLTITSLPPLYRHEMIERMSQEVAVQLSRVAEREAINAELAAARDRALEASEQKSAFLSTMSHEIRTPLNGVIGLTELLGRTDLDEQQRHLIAGVDLSSRSLLAIINDVLDFSKIEAGHLELEDVDFDLGAVLEQVVGLLAEQARARQLDLTLTTDPDLPQVSAGDPTRLAQVLTNLGSNAVKFTPTGGVAVHAGLVPGPDGPDGARGPDQLRIEVRDTGVGVPPDRLATIFDPFAQADTSTTRQYGGTGLGLAISQEIVEAMGGRLQVESTVGHGSTFSFTLPVRAPRGLFLVDTLDRARVTLRGLRVLVVEHARGRTPDVTEQLAWWDVEAHGVTGPAQVGAALGAVRTPYDAVLVDLTGADDEGRAEVLAAVAVLARHPGRGAGPVVALVRPGAEHEPVAGIDRLVPTPVTSETLGAVLLGTVGHPATGTGPGTVAAAAADGADGAVQRRLLVVEDNAVNQLVAVGFLEALGWSADVAPDGTQALALLAERDYALVLMDVQMPGIDGYETTRIIREREAATGGARLPVVAMTASAVDGERERALQAGLDDYLTKPVTGAGIAAVLSRWLSAPGGDGAQPAESPQPVGQPVGEQPASAGALDEERLGDLLELSPDGSYLRRATAGFLDRLPLMVAAVLEAPDPQQLSAAAHALKGSASNLGAHRVAALAHDVEVAGLGGWAADAGTLEALVGACDEAATAMTAWWERRDAAVPAAVPAPVPAPVPAVVPVAEVR